jgi:hypothetical protein
MQELTISRVARTVMVLAKLKLMTLSFKAPPPAAIASFLPQLYRRPPSAQWRNLP